MPLFVDIYCGYSYISFAPVQLSPALTSSPLWQAAVVFSPRWLALLFKLTLKLLTQKLSPLELPQNAADVFLNLIYKFTKCFPEVQNNKQ